MLQPPVLDVLGPQDSRFKVLREKHSTQLRHSLVSRCILDGEGSAKQANLVKSTTRSGFTGIEILGNGLI